MSRFEKILLHASVLLAALSGGVLFWMKHLLASRDPFSVVHHPWQPAVLAAHVLVVPLLVFALGLITRDHIVGRFLDGSARPGRRSGIGAILLALSMIASGYLLQVLTGADARRLMALVHAACGGAFTIAYIAHVLLSGPLRGTVRGPRGRARSGRRARGAGGRLAWSRVLGLKSPAGSRAPRPRPEPDGRAP